MSGTGDTVKKPRSKSTRRSAEKRSRSSEHPSVRSRGKRCSFDNPGFIYEEEQEGWRCQNEINPTLTPKLSMEAKKPALRRPSQPNEDQIKEKVTKSVHFFDEEHLEEAPNLASSQTNILPEQHKVPAKIGGDKNECEKKKPKQHVTSQMTSRNERRRSGSEEFVKFQGGHEDLYDRGFCCMGYPKIALHSLMDDNLEITGVVIHCGPKNVVIKQGFAFDIGELQYLNDIIQDSGSSCDAELKLKHGGINWDFTQQCYHFRRTVWVMSSMVIRSVCYCGLNIICVPIFHRLVSGRCQISRAFHNPDDWTFFKNKLNSITPSRDLDLSNVAEVHRKTIYETLDAS